MRDSPHPRVYGCGTSSNPPSPPVLQELGECQDKEPQERRFLRIHSGDRHRHEVGSNMVVEQSKSPQWSSTTDKELGHHNRVRCLQTGVGALQLRQEHRRALDPTREVFPHKLPRAPGSILGAQVICLTEARDLGLATPRQCHSHCFLEQDGRNTFTDALQSGNRDLDLVYGTQHYNPCRTLAGEKEPSCGLGVAPLDRLQRLDAEARCLPPAPRNLGTIHNRPLCFQNEYSTPHLLQLETRSSSPGSGCLVNIVEGSLPLHFPTIHSHSTVLEQAQAGSNLSSPNSTHMAQSGVVSIATEESDRHTNPAPTDSGHPAGARRITSPNGNGRAPTSSRMACIWQRYNAGGLSDGVIKMLNKSWRGSTETAYSSAWRQWDHWCSERGISSLSAPLSAILGFLLVLFNKGRQYRTINTVRSAISMTHDDVDGTRVGQHPLVSRFLKGIFNSRPPAPKYCSTWNVDIVLSYIKKLPENKELSFQLLSHKLAMLMALANADRCSDLVALDLNYHTFQGTGVRFIIPGLTKTRRSGPPIEAFYASFSEDPRICPVETLKCYKLRSKNLRPQSEGSGNPLFISVRKPHNPIKAATLGHWLKNIMRSAGIDTQTFSGHSTRGASMSKAKVAGVSTADILKAANWSNSSTFCRFYHRPVNSGQFGTSVLMEHQLSKNW